LPEQVYDNYNRLLTLFFPKDKKKKYVDLFRWVYPKCKCHADKVAFFLNPIGLTTNEEGPSVMPIGIAIINILDEYTLTNLPLDFMAKLDKKINSYEEEHPELKVFREFTVKRNLQMEGVWEGIERLFGQQEVGQQRDDNLEIRELFQ
jgi:hypothetical protein